MRASSNWLVIWPFQGQDEGSIPSARTKGVWQNSPTLTKLLSSQRPPGVPPLVISRDRVSKMYKGVVMTRGTGPYLAFRQCRTMGAR